MTRKFWLVGYEGHDKVDVLPLSMYLGFKFDLDKELEKNKIEFVEVNSNYGQAKIDREHFIKRLSNDE